MRGYDDRKDVKKEIIVKDCKEYVISEKEEMIVDK